MNTSGLLVLAALVVVVVVLAFVWVAFQRRRTDELRERYGPEYEHAVEEAGSKRRAEAQLEARRKRVDALQIQPLTLEQYERFATAWRSTQARFVDEPHAAIAEANRLVKEVMQARGYPVGDFDQRVADLSVHHSYVVTHYRAAGQIAEANDTEVSTEELRQAMVHYRALFDDLLEVAPEPA
jgi:hypothetical protein